MHHHEVHRPLPRGVVGMALGSNLGDRLHNLRIGVERLLQKVVGMHVRGVAPIYETVPVDCPEGAGAFFNTVIEVFSPLDPHDLRRATADIERELGRPQFRGRHAPRVLDMDLLYFDDLMVADEELILPHPRLQERRFVLAPLADIRGELLLPGQVKTIGELLIGLSDDKSVRRVTDDSWLVFQRDLH